ncbi:MAG: ABC transporter ATP-binding protein [Cyanobacteriota bacterium]|nr:ABC transporter ATP-binding protein [Cyanobacteriota bacterium]
MRARHLFNFELQRVFYLGRALRIVWESAPYWTIFRFVLVLIQSCIPIVSLYIMKTLIDRVTLGFASQENNFSSVIPLIFAMGGVNLLGAIDGACMGLVAQVQNQVISDRLFDMLHRKAVRVDLEHYENSDYYDVLHRAKGEASSGPMRIVGRAHQIIGSSISLLTMAGTLFLLNWWIAGLLFVPVLPRILVRLKFVHIIHEWIERRTATQRQAGYYNTLLTSDNYAKEIRLFGLGDLFIRRFTKLRRQLLKEKLQISTRRAVADFLTTIISVVAMWGAYAYIAYNTVQGNITVGDLVLYNQAFRKAYQALWGVLNGFASLYEDNQYLAYLFEFLDLEATVVDPVDPKPIPRPMRSGIEFKNVDFQYPGSARQALKDVSLKIRPGEVIALVGENGSGKTTLIKLLCRLYDPSKGKICIDDVDVRDVGLAELRQQISVIFQDYAKYQLTARENIWLGNVDASLEGHDIEQAARRSGAHEVIETLPQQYDNLLGKRFEKGEELSIGQWQKVSIARAFLRDSQLIVLDEPTSALDPKAEYEVFKKFRELLEGQSAVLITHRLSTVKMADCIYVLDGGHIVERGSHEELIALGGTYARLFEIQAKNYR